MPIITNKYPGKCLWCGEIVHPNVKVKWTPEEGIEHFPECPPIDYDSIKVPAEKAPPPRMLSSRGRTWWMEYDSSAPYGHRIRVVQCYAPSRLSKPPLNEELEDAWFHNPLDVNELF